MLDIFVTVFQVYKVSSLKSRVRNTPMLRTNNLTPNAKFLITSLMNMFPMYYNVLLIYRALWSSLRAGKMYSEASGAKRIVGAN